MTTEVDVDGFRELAHLDDERTRPRADFLIAVVTVVTREINLLRAEHGLSPRTRVQVTDAIKSAMDDLTIE